MSIEQQINDLAEAVRQTNEAVTKLVEIFETGVPLSEEVRSALKQSEYALFRAEIV